MVNKNLDDDRVVKYIIVPLLFIVLILIVLIPEWTRGGLVAFALLGFSYLVFNNKNFDKSLIGIPKNPLKGILWGFLFFITFIILLTIFPLSFLVPTVPQALSDFSVGDLAIGTQLTFIVIVFIFPLAEEAWRISAITLLMKTFGWSFLTANIVQGFVLFGFILHLLAYGVVLAAAETFGIAINQIQSISGLLFTAGIFGTIAGFLLWKTRNYFTTAIAHILTNFTIVTTTLAIIKIL